MMNYSTGQGGQAVNEASPMTNQNSVTPANTTRTRVSVRDLTATGGNVGMNISTGGPHILLFERDQQLVALLTSELQLAGYECHAARTAVEVFDAIARYPVRLVLVNLAQAAAARREFWVALDTQRRGRGVQVLTFHCTNLAGYGPSIDDGEERSHTVLADLEVDGMLGIMDMVNAIRSRIVLSNSRLTANAGSTPPIGTQATSPLPTLLTNNHGQPPQPPLGNAFTVASPESRTSPPNPTDKIRAVIYPNQRSWSTSPARDNSAGSGQYAVPGEVQHPQNTNWTAQQSSSSIPANPSPSADAPANGQERRSASGTAMPIESGLAQLSRMLEEQRSPLLEELAQRFAADPASNRQLSPGQEIDAGMSTNSQVGRREQENQFQENAALQPQARPEDVTPISAMPLRASPIQDLPTNRGGQSDSPSQTSSRRIDEPAQSQYTYSQSSPSLMSITATPNSSVISPTERIPAAPTQAPSPTAQPVPQRKETENQNFVESAYGTQFVAHGEPSTGEKLPGTSQEERSYSGKVRTGVEQTQGMVPTDAHELSPTQEAPDNLLLLDIVQSLPPMSSPPPQPPQIHNGRATRSLGSVLLEGHLVPQNRLEVAQGIQRMLRGVDMNYQLGEILLMFKLLTPDQLLAASLVSYGLITTAQISALGRIRQELHSIGLEYDLENLLILFRILTSEQLREVRASWAI